MHAVDVVTVRDVADDRSRVRRRLGRDRRQIQAFDFRRLVTGIAREPADVARAVRIDAREFVGERTRHHQPFGMTVDHVLARRGQLGGAGNQVHVDPCVDAQSRRVRRGDRRGQRIERGLGRQRCGARLDARLKVGVATPAHLNEQRVEAAVLRLLHHRRDRGWRRERRAYDPQRADLVLSVERRDEEDE